MCIIELSAREVVAAGSPFRAWGETFADPGVALDEILSLRARQDPLVLRVKASGVCPPEAEAAAGDWLCDSDGSPPRRLPRPSWRHDRRSSEWAWRRTWPRAWEECRNGAWMMRGICDLPGPGVDRRAIVSAACACVRISMGDGPVSGLTEGAIAAAEAWTRGEAGPGEVRRAAQESYNQLRHDAYAAGSAAFAATHEGPSMAYHAVTNAMSWQLARGGEGSIDAAASSMADAIRSRVPTIAVLRAAAASASAR